VAKGVARSPDSRGRMRLDVASSDSKARSRAGMSGAVVVGAGGEAVARRTGAGDAGTVDRALGREAGPVGEGPARHRTGVSMMTRE